MRLVKKGDKAVGTGDLALPWLCGLLLYYTETCHTIKESPDKINQSWKMISLTALISGCGGYLTIETNHSEKWASKKLYRIISPRSVSPAELLQLKMHGVKKKPGDYDITYTWRMALSVLVNEAPASLRGKILDSLKALERMSWGDIDRLGRFHYQILSKRKKAA